MKSSRLWMLLLASTLATNGWARDITTTTGKVFHNAVVTKVQADGIRIEHDDGVGFVNFQILTEPDRKEFGFDPTAYATAEKDEANFEKRARELRLLAAQQTLAAWKRASDQAAAYAAQAPLNPWPTTMEVGLQTPDFSYNTFGNSGWTSWPYVPSAYYNYNTQGFAGRFRSAFTSPLGGRSGGAISMSSAASRR